ncbi:major facilitator superfamily domain-containing protein [Baffinella frigidus]|nr:major facilitator superfamily domain-containing protein [Cryptophyta sp. CCMP2293]
MDISEAGADAPNSPSGWADRVKAHKRLIFVDDSSTGFISEVSDYLDTDGGATDVEDGDMTEYGDTETEPLMAAVSERNVAPVDESEDFVSPHPCLGTDEQDVTAGVIEGCMPIMAGAIQPLWGYVADTTGHRWTVVVVTRVVNTSIMMLLAWPAVATGFPNLLLISLAMCLFSSGGILDGITLEVLGPHAKRLYGSLRLWCAVSWGGGAVVMGLVNDRFGFDYNFALYALFLVIQLFTLYFALPKSIRDSSRDRSRSTRGTPLEGTKDAAASPGKGSFWGGSSAGVERSGLHDALWKRGGALFLAEVLVFGFSMGVIEKGLLFVYLINSLGASTTLCGAVVGVTVIFELPVFHYSHQILDVLGTEGALLISYLTYVIRLVGYTLLTPETVYWIFALEILHGFTFALLWIAAVAHVHSITPVGWAGTMQSLLSTAQGSLGQGLGVIVGGSVMQHYGAIFMFQCAAAIGSTLVLWRSALLIVHIVDRRKQAQEHARAHLGRGWRPADAE